MSDVNAISHKEDNAEADMDEFKKLQQRLNHESIKYQFRTKLVGGLNEEDVTKYIVDLEDKLKKIEQDNKKSSDDIYSLKNKLNMEIKLKDNIQSGLDEAKQNLITAIVEFKQKQMEYKSLNEKNCSENLQLKNDIQLMIEEQKTLKTLINESNYEKEQLKQYTAKAEEENQLLKITISELSEEKSQLDYIKNENNKRTEELRAIEKLLNQATTEREQLIEVSEKLKNENNQIKIRMSQSAEENTHIDAIKNENIQMAEEIKAYEELLNHASNEYDQLVLNANKAKDENILLNEKISGLENSISAQDYKLNEINEVCENLKEELQIEKSNNEKLNMDSTILKQKINSLQQTINEKLKELEQQKKINEETLLELNMGKAEVLNYKVNGYKQEFGSIVEKMDSLDREVKQSSKLSSILKQNLTIQQNRAEKAENDLAKIMELLSHVGDKFNDKRDILGDEFIQLIEKQITKRPQINDKIINL